jgi:hypothetical protein
MGKPQGVESYGVSGLNWQAYHDKNHYSSLHNFSRADVSGKISNDCIDLLTFLT